MKRFLTTNLLKGLVIAVSFLTLSAAHAEDSKVTTKVEGFGSAYYGQALSSDITPFGFSSGATAINTKADFTHFNLIGTDLNAKFNDEWSAAAEVIASGGAGAVTNYQAFAQWAYVTYKPSENTTLRLGRQRYPLFTASEYVNNHAELPYREVPAIVFRSAPFSTFDGAMAQQMFDIGIGKLSVGIFGGTPLLDSAASPIFNLAFSSLIGGKLTLDGDGWRIRIQDSTLVGNLIINNPAGGAPLDTESAALNNFSAGYRFDKYNLVTWGEYFVGTSNGGTEPAIAPLGIQGGKFIGSTEVGYVLVGYRIGNFLPRYTFASAQHVLGFAQGQTQSHTVGVNYKFNDNVVGKLEYEYDKIPSAGGGNNVTQSATSTATNASAVYAGVDFKF